MHQYLELRVDLLHVKPPIWRSFLLSKAATFEQLHHAIQDACGWMDCHLYAFHAKKGRRVLAGIPDDEWGEPCPDAAKVEISTVLRKADDSCHYIYDFGDDWLHEVKVRKIVKLEDSFVRRLTGGKRAFPPEDCGGIPGHWRCVAIREGQDVGLSPDELAEQKEWLGDWQPEEFDLAASELNFNR